MRIARIISVSLIVASLLLVMGCEPECKDLKIQNNTQRKRISQLESEKQSTALQISQLERQVAAAQQRESIETGALGEKVDALEKMMAKKDEMIAQMQEQLVYGIQLPVELSTLLQDFASSQSMVEYDSSRGVVKFQSDLLFEKGSDTVASSAVSAIKSLCEILNNEQGQKFDVIIAGHTDDIRIGKPQTKAKHPTNWHLSAHRAISVLRIMSGNNINPDRLSVRGFGEFRPIAQNKPNRKGNSLNRRVEIYIVPKGM